MKRKTCQGFRDKRRKEQISRSSTNVHTHSFFSLSLCSCLSFPIFFHSPISHVPLHLILTHYILYLAINNVYILIIDPNTNFVQSRQWIDHFPMWYLEGLEFQLGRQKKLQEHIQKFKLMEVSVIFLLSVLWTVIVFAINYIKY